MIHPIPKPEIRPGPVTLARDRLLPVLPEFQGLFPSGGLQRGWVVSITGSTYLALALLAGPTAAGSWSAAVGIPTFGAVAAAELGVALDRVALIPNPGSNRAKVVAALLDAVDVVLLGESGKIARSDARRLGARTRERGAVLMTLAGWDNADIRLAASAKHWHGLGDGHGYLKRCTFQVKVVGRGAASKPRHALLSLPAIHGRVA